VGGRRPTAGSILTSTMALRPLPPPRPSYSTGVQLVQRITMAHTSTTDKAFLTAQLSTLSHPLTSSTLPPTLLRALNASNSRTLKLKLSTNAIRSCVQQLDALRDDAVKEREERRERERGGRVRLKRGEQGWWETMPSRWPVVGKEEKDEATR
jgi:hypothetical protein